VVADSEFVLSAHLKFDWSRAMSRLREERRDARTLKGAGRKPIMFKILELESAASAPAAEIGRGYSTREEALAAVKTHLRTFKVSGHNPEENYWWARDAEGLRKCWISNAD
jgi:CelD/BcsL family acetyltransferase involved in cellulose biosynthesis